MDRPARSAAMRSRLAFGAVVLAAVVVAFALSEGAPDSPPRAAAADPERRLDAFAQPGEPVAATVAAELFDLAPGAPSHRVDVELPARTTTVLVDVAFTGGAGFGFRVQGLACDERVTGPGLARDSGLSLDCGPAEGAASFVLGVDVGALQGAVTVTALVCPPERTCGTMGAAP